GAAHPRAFLGTASGSASSGPWQLLLLVSALALPVGFILPGCRLVPARLCPLNCLSPVRDWRIRQRGARRVQGAVIRFGSACLERCCADPSGKHNPLVTGSSPVRPIATGRDTKEQDACVGQV